MSRDDEALERALRAALAAHVADAVPGPSQAVRRRVWDGLALRRRSRPRGRRLVLALVAVVVLLALATGVGLATGLLNQPIVELPRSVWLQHFAQQHHGSTGKGSAGPGQVTDLAEAQRRAGFHVHTLNGVPGARLTQVTSNVVTYRDGSKEPEVILRYAVGSFTVDVIELGDPNPKQPFEIPALTTPNMRVETIDGAQYLFLDDSQGGVRDVQFKSADGVVFSVNFFGPTVSSRIGPGAADHQLASDVVLHLR
jgi:hypothetical protein